MNSIGEQLRSTRSGLFVDFLEKEPGRGQLWRPLVRNTILNLQNLIYRDLYKIIEREGINVSE